MKDRKIRLLLIPEPVEGQLRWIAQGLAIDIVAALRHTVMAQFMLDVLPGQEESVGQHAPAPMAYLEMFADAQ